MKIDVLEKRENPFLKRTDLLLAVDHDKQPTPKKEELVKAIADMFKSVPEKVEINYIFSEVGITKARVKAKVWEEKPPEKKKKVKEEKLKEEKVEKKEEKVEKEVKPEEKPAEKKEETKPVEKKEGGKSEA
jgi:ribosomal protein S24E